MNVTTDRERPVVLTCNQNHTLNYLKEVEEYHDVCCQCMKRKYIRLACISCEEGQQMYCFQCRPIELKNCYFRHSLRQVNLEYSRECQVCSGFMRQFQHCGKCDFFVCEGCVGVTLATTQMQVKGEKLEIEGKQEESKASGD